MPAPEWSPSLPRTTHDSAMSNDPSIPTSRASNHRYRFATFTVDENTRRLWREQTKVELAPRAFELLLLLLRAPGRVCRREEIFEALWPGVIVGDAALTQTVSQLRRALDDSDRKFIRTVSKSGYAFEGAVQIETTEALTVADSAAPTPPIVPPANGIDHAIRPLPIRASAWSFRRKSWLAASLLSVVAAIIVIAQDRPQAHPENSPSIILAPPAPADGQTGAWLDEAIRGIVAVERAGDSRFELDTTPSGNSAAYPDSTYQLASRYAIQGEPGARRVKVDWQLSGPRGKTWQWQNDVASDDVQALSDLLDSGLAQRIPGWQRTTDPIAGSVAESALKHFSDGMLAAHDYRYADARAAFDQALAISPDFVLARYQLALALSRLGFGDLAIAQAKRALQQPGQRADSETHRMLTIWLHELSSEYTEAVRLLEVMLAQQTSNISLRLRLVFDAVRAHQLDKARETLDALDPTKLAPIWAARWYYCRSDVDAASGNFREAVIDAQQSVEFAKTAHDERAVALANKVLSDAWLRLHDSVEALKAVRAAEIYYEKSRETLQFFRTRSQRMEISFDLGETVAASDIDALVATARQLGDPQLEAIAEALQARLLITRFDYAAAREHYRQSESTLLRISDQLDAEDYGTLVGTMDILLGDFERARQRYAALYAREDTLGADIWSTSATYADLLAENGEHAAAIKAFDRTIAIGDKQSLPGARRARCQRGREHIALGQLDLAALDIDSCIAEELKTGETAREKESAAALMTGLIGRAWLAHLRSDDTAAMRQLAEAQALWEQADDITALDSIAALIEAYAVIATPAEARQIVQRFQHDKTTTGAVHFQALTIALACAVELRDTAGATQNSCSKLGDLSNTQSWRLKTRVALLELCTTSPLPSAKIMVWLSTTPDQGDAQLVSFAIALLQSRRFESQLSAPLKTQLGLINRQP